MLFNQHSVGSFATFLAFCGYALGDKIVSVDAKSNWGTWEGWGVSLAWWAKAFGNRDDLADVFFTTKDTVVNGEHLPGLGFNIVRYNAGASSDKPYNGSSMVVSPNIQPSRQIDGFWLDWASTDPASPSWDWSVDANQRDMLQKSKARGANIFELFSNSPMWWMCKNHNPSGGANASQDNLQEWNYDSHAIYLANVAQYAEQNWGITFRSVEAFNEPSSAYWSATGTQEGCHFDVSTMDQVIGQLSTELAKRNLGSAVAASDETAYDAAVSTWTALTNASKNIVQRINVHGYQGAGGRRDVLYDLAKQSGKKLWNSEFGDGDGSGKSMFTDMLLDFTWLHPTAWVYWQAVDISGWGLITGDNDAKTISNASVKYYVLAHFTRHIRPGMRFLTTPDGSTAASFDSAGKKLVIVAANWDAPQKITFDLTQFGTHGSDQSLIKRWSTETAGSERYAFHTDVTLNGGQFSAQFASGQVQTFEISGISV